ncbi:MAG: hypothetical protein ACPGSB_07990, partial [Opitutales bacterium]
MNKPSMLLTAAFAVGLGPLAATAAPLNPAELSADTDWFVHVDAESLMSGPAGDLIDSRMNE